MDVGSKEYLRRAGWSYEVAFRFLPWLEHRYPSRFLADFESHPLDAARSVYLLPGSNDDLLPDPDDLRQIAARSGTLDGGLRFLVITFPVFPPLDMDAAAWPIQDLEAMMSRWCPAPYFAAFVYSETYKLDRYFVLSQKPGGGTTLRLVSTEENANLGRGPEPTEEGFLAAIQAWLSGKPGSVRRHL